MEVTRLVYKVQELALDDCSLVTASLSSCQDKCERGGKSSAAEEAVVLPLQQGSQANSHQPWELDHRVFFFLEGMNVAKRKRAKQQIYLIVSTVDGFLFLTTFSQVLNNISCNTFGFCFTQLEM